MSFYQELLDQTAQERADFISIRLISHVVENGVSRNLYADFLSQAYHHVRHTCPLLQAALERCGPQDETYKTALQEYIREEEGHDEWILDDIRALGFDDQAVRAGQARLACRVMVSHAYFQLDKVSPYALLGMVHVLEGMSMLLADKAAKSIAESLGDESLQAFSYLTSHGTLDIEHVAFFESLVNTISDQQIQKLIINSAKDFYRLYGDIFRDIDVNRTSS
ncbi:MAG: iron-containing redox enzyme family protein [Rhodospirillaceae bacterium]|nr:iron-containing redox enzyme family protein [Rhodospirillaceae bacterium]MBL6929860.1 iron-containing redox enzyme family protein [Rhodospirillales bacterium]MBL6941629.1 iron-containing redox enzyme family protein [Rhodospirillales bacterium]